MNKSSSNSQNTGDYEDGLHPVPYDSEGLEAVPPSDLPESAPWQQQYHHHQPYDKAQSPYPTQGYHSATSPPFDSHTYVPSLQYAEPGIDVANDAKPPVAEVRRDKILGMKRKVFIIVVAVAVLIVVIAIAVGLGVGLANRHESSPPNTIPTTDTSNITCPEDNNAIYRANGTERYFQVFCGIDYNSQGGSTELSSGKEDTFSDCINACAAAARCIAAGWGSYYDVNTCFLKTAIGSSNVSGSWMFTKQVDKPSYA